MNPTHSAFPAPPPLRAHSGGSSVQRSAQFNIVLIVLDATRARNLSCYGYHRPTTPDLERFASRCMVYETAISPAGWSLPAHASIFTGLYPLQHGAFEQHKYLAREYPTMAEHLRARGYCTVAVCNNRYVSPATGLDRGFQRFYQEAPYLLRVLNRVIWGLDSALPSLRELWDPGDLRVNAQVLWVLRALHLKSQPFFLFVHYHAGHMPYRPPRRYNRYLPAGISHREAMRVPQDPWPVLANVLSMDDLDCEILMALYDAAISYADMSVAQVLRWLEKWGTLDRTLVIITADHGENIGEHGMVAHNYCLYDTLVHVPLLIHCPAGWGAPDRHAYQVQTVDLFPTILDLLGELPSELYHSLPGHSLLSSARHEFTVAEWDRPDLSPFHRRYPGMDVSRFDRALKMIRTEDHKYIWASDGRHELYDLRADAGEVHNLIAERPGLAADLAQRLADWQSSFEPAHPTREAPAFDKAVRGRLRALGYLE